ncbi:thermonuclease family protein [Candidatus Pacearchaeota archaeon]|nr:thermonuclease family protein [Candidatus Pacearchaeota archaeon]
MGRTITIYRWEFDLVNLIITGIALLVILSLIFFIIPSLKNNLKDINTGKNAEVTADNSSINRQEATAIQVIDGDTFQIQTGEYVRLIGINAPERTEKYYDESTSFLRSLIFDKAIILESDLDNRDSYGRLLRYAYSSDGKLINEELVRRGYAIPMEVTPNLKYREKISDAYRQCISERLRLCGE